MKDSIYTTAEAQIIKIVFLGDSGVGKTSIINRYCDNEFTTMFNSTKSAIFKKASVYLECLHTEIELRIWDTAGQETYRSLASFYCKDTNAIFLVYDITNQKSFDALPYWINKVKQYSPEDCLFTIIGNKSDCIDKIAVDMDLGKEYAMKNDAVFISTSAKDNVNIKALFENVVMRKFKDTDSCIIKSNAKKSFSLNNKKTKEECAC